LHNYTLKQNLKKNLKKFVDVDGVSYVCKMVENFHQKNSVTSLIIILKNSKTLDNGYNDLKD
jgi:hypothetical protein